MKNTIAFIIPNLRIGGAQRIFINYLKSIDPNQFEIYLILVKREGQFLEYVPSYVNIISLNEKRTRFSFFSLLKNIKKISPNLVVTTTNYLNILVLATSFFSSKNILYCLYEPSMPSAQIENKHFPKYYFMLIKYFYKKADYLIAQTDEMKDEIIDYYNKPKKEILVLINPLDYENINKLSTVEPNAYNSDKINVIISGRISEEKGHIFLIKSFKSVVEQNSKFVLNILGEIGDKNYYDQIVSLIKKLKLSNNINFLGFRNNPYPYYKNADLLVLSSKWEGLPNVVLEALYLQTPVVVTDCIPFFKKFLKEGENGFIVDFNDMNGMSKAILKFSDLHVTKNVVPKIDMNKIFMDMVQNV